MTIQVRDLSSSQPFVGNPDEIAAHLAELGETAVQVGMVVCATVPAIDWYGRGRLTTALATPEQAARIAGFERPPRALPTRPTYVVARPAPGSAVGRAAVTAFLLLFVAVLVVAVIGVIGE